MLWDDIMPDLSLTPLQLRRRGRWSPWWLPWCQTMLSRPHRTGRRSRKRPALPVAGSADLPIECRKQKFILRYTNYNKKSQYFTEISFSVGWCCSMLLEGKISERFFKSCPKHGPFLTTWSEAQERRRKEFVDFLRVFRLENFNKHVNHVTFSKCLTRRIPWNAIVQAPQSKAKLDSFGSIFEIHWRAKA